MNSSHRRRRGAVVAVSIAVLVVLTMAVGYAWWNNAENKLENALAERSKDRGTKTYISDFDLICFNFNNANTRDEFASEAARLGQPFANSLQTCGIDRSCCSLDSDTSGAIGLVKGDAIRCVEIKTFLFMTREGRPLCVKPARLSIQRKTFSTRTNPPGRPWFGNPGDRYFEIGED